MDVIAMVVVCTIAEVVGKKAVCSIFAGMMT